MPESNRTLQAMPPMKIGLLTHSVNPRGGVVHTIELAHALHDQGHDVTVMAPAAAGERFFRTVRCKTEFARVTGKPRGMVEMVASRIDAYVTHLSAHLQTHRYDVLHCHDGIGGNALALLQERGSIDGFVRTVHHLDDFEDAQLMRWQTRSFMAARQVFSASRMWCDVLRQSHGVQADEVWNGVDATRFTPMPSAADAVLAQRLGIRTGSRLAPVVLALGGVEQRKNTLRTLQAFVRLRAERPDAQLVIAGGATLLDHSRYAREFEALVREAGLACGPGRSLVLTGPVDDEDMPSLYRLASVVAMPSLREGFGLVTLESLASGVPVVVSRIAPFTEYLEEGDCAWCDPIDAESIAAALSQAIGRKDAEHIAASSQRLARRFSWAASARRHAELYARHRVPATA